MSVFADRIKKYNSQKETKVNPPEASKVLEEKSRPEAENVKAQPAAAAAATVSSASSEAAHVASSASAPSADQSTSSEAGAPTEGKAKRGRPPGSKNSPKPPAAEPTSEATSLRSAEPAELAAELKSRGYCAHPVDDELGANAQAVALLQMGGEGGRAWAVETRVLVSALFDRGYSVTRL